MYGEVIDVRGATIPGLYGAGNAVAAMSGPANWGGGGTLGPGVVDGWMAGRHAAGFTTQRWTVDPAQLTGSAR